MLAKSQYSCCFLWQVLDVLRNRVCVLFLSCWAILFFSSAKLCSRNIAVENFWEIFLCVNNINCKPFQIILQLFILPPNKSLNKQVKYFLQYPVIYSVSKTSICSFYSIIYKVYAKYYVGFHSLKYTDGFQSVHECLNYMKNSVWMCF